MNVDILENNPHWWLFIVVGVSLFILVILGWVLWKFKRSFLRMVKRGRKKAAKRSSSDLEPGVVTDAHESLEFSPPQRQWTTKLKYY